MAQVSTKDFWRKKIKNIRDKISLEEKIMAEKKIRKKIYSLKEYKNSKLVMSYVSFSNEVDTRIFIKETLKTKRVAVPKIDFMKKEIIPVEINSLNGLEKNRYGILEPTSFENKVAVNEIDLVIVPGIVFDINGYRIGYGGGYYDRFLVKIPQEKTLGICFDFQIIDCVPRNSYDVRVKKIITEKRIILC